MTTTPWWARESAWRKIAVWVTALMAVVLIFLTFDTLSKTQVGGNRVPAFGVINQRIDYQFDRTRNRFMPVIGEAHPLFGNTLTEAEAEALVRRGKLTVQAKNCMNCHTLLGNGAYYAPDLTKAWLDRAWGNEAAREELMLRFLRDPAGNARTFGTGRRMPNLDITEDEAKAVIAFLKWMAAIDTNGFPDNFKPIAQGPSP
jgi:nitric oxide reductase subunit C